MADVKFSGFTPGGAIQTTDQVVGLNSTNARWTFQQVLNLINSFNLSGLASYATAQDNLRLHKGAVLLDLQTDPNYQITNPIPTVIEIENSDSGTPGGTKIILPVFNAAFSMREGDYFIIENHSTNAITVYDNDGTTEAATIPSGRYILCSPRDNATSNGSLFALTGATVFDSGVTGVIAVTTILQSNVLDLTTDLAAKQDKYRTVTNINLSTTVGASHESCLLLANSAAPITITVPQTSTTALDVGYWFDIINIGAGTVTVVKEGSDTLGGNTQCDTGAKMSVVKDVAGSPNAWQTAGGTSVIPVQYSINYYGIIAGTDAYPLTPPVAEATTFTSVTCQTDGSNVTGNIINAGTVVNGGSITVTSSYVTTSLITNNVVAIGDNLKFTPSAATAAKNAVFLLKGTVRRS